MAKTVLVTGGSGSIASWAIVNLLKGGYLRDIFAEAVDQDFLVKDPARKVKVPTQLRTIATLAQKKGTVKDIQGVLRHSRTATTTDVYMQEIPESVQSTINSINLELRKSSAQGRETPKKAASTGLVVRSRRKPSASVTQDDTNFGEGGSASLLACASL